MPDRAATDPSDALRKVVLVPLVGPLHVTFPAYNTVTVRDFLEAAIPAAVATTALEPGALDDPLWRDTPEIALPHMVVPWAEGRGTPIVPVGMPSPDPSATADFVRYAQEYPALRSAWQEVERREAPLRELLATPLTLDRIVQDALPVLAEAQRVREETFGDGPATDWLRQRAAHMADRVRLAVIQAGGPVAVVAPLDHVPLLQEALAERKVAVTFPEQAPVSDAARLRSLLDYAMRVDVPEPERVLRNLREVDRAEARYHEANILLANGHGAEALERLEEASRGDFSRPYWLPGFLLTRLGQLYDLAGNREAAVRAYRGVRALEYAPPDARAAAARGIEEPFDPEEARA